VGQGEEDGVKERKGRVEKHSKATKYAPKKLMQKHSEATKYAPKK
jgi:hypothetical protein